MNLKPTEEEEGESFEVSFEVVLKPKIPLKLTEF